LIDRKKNNRRKRPSRFSSKRPNGSLRSFVDKGMNAPKSKVGISKALEKYTGMAEDAFSNGDRIVAESYYQYAEHYQRLLNEVLINEPNLPKDSVANNSDEANPERPSRTQRAINAKNEREISKQDENQGDRTDSNPHEIEKTGDKKVTSDGIEALKPYEV
jgi:rubrerythrin